MKTTIGEIRQVIRETAETVKPKRVPRWQQEIQNKWEKLKTTVSSTRRELDSALERADVAINAIEDRKDQSALILVLQQIQDAKKIMDNLEQEARGYVYYR